MAFNKDSKTKSKMQFTARLVSKKTGAMVSWLNLTDDFARKVFGVQRVDELTAEQVESTLPALLDNAFVEVAVTDLMESHDPIDAVDF